MTKKIELNEVFIETTNRCNFNCTFCPYHLVSRKKEDMQKDRVLQLLDEIEESFSFQWISFHLYGEPLLYPDLLEVFSYASMKKMNVNFTTNVSLLTIEYLEKLILAGVWRIVLSVQTTPEQFFTRGDKKMNGEAYQEHLENIVEEYLVLQKKYPTCRMEIHYLTSEKFKPGLKMVEGEDEVNSIVETWSNLINQNNQTQTAFNSKELIVNDPLEEETGVLYKLTEGLFIRFKPAISFGNAIADPSSTQKNDLEKCYSAYCFFPSTSLAILVNGDLVSCCLDYNGENVLGNVFKDGGVKKVYQGDKAQKFREQFQEKNIISTRCQECLGGVFYGSPI